jgi:hypothetical protein
LGLIHSERTCYCRKDDDDDGFVSGLKIIGFDPEEFADWKYASGWMHLGDGACYESDIYMSPF